MKLLAFANLTGYVEKVDPSHSTLMMGGLTLHFNESLADVYDGDVIVAEAQCDDMGTWHASIKSMLSNVFIAAAANASENSSYAAGAPPTPAPAPAPHTPLPQPAHTPVAASALSSRSTQFNRSNAPAPQTGVRSTPSPTATPQQPARSSASAPAALPATGSSRAARFGKGLVAGGSSSASRPAADGPVQRPSFNSTANTFDDSDADVPF
jgi:hypothetical protein